MCVPVYKRMDLGHTFDKIQEKSLSILYSCSPQTNFIDRLTHKYSTHIYMFIPNGLLKKFSVKVILI